MRELRFLKLPPFEEGKLCRLVQRLDLLPAQAELADPLDVLAFTEEEGRTLLKDAFERDLGGSVVDTLERNSKCLVHRISVDAMPRGDPKVARLEDRILELAGQTDDQLEEEKAHYMRLIRSKGFHGFWLLAWEK